MHSLGGVVGVKNGDGGKAHERAIAGRVRGRGAAEWLACLLKLVQRLAHGVANIEARACTAQIPLLVPCQITAHLVGRVEALFFHQTGRQTERHRGVVCPLPRLQAKRPPTHHVGDRRKGAAWLKFERCTHGIADGQAHQTTLEAFLVHRE